jgi:hypothetical protein
VQGSWLTGVRYIELSEDFTLSSVSQLNDTFSRYNVNTYNGLVGGQGGGDLWLCVIPGFSIGAEVKMGLFMNNAKQNTFFTSTTLETAPQVPLEESVEDDNDFTFVTEANFMANWRLSQSWTVRGGYSFIALNGVALATENFNAVPPFVVPPFVFPPRNPVVNTDGDLFMHGFTIGAEYMW